MNMTTAVNILTCLFESIIFFMFINSYVESKKSLPDYVYAGAVVVLAAMIYFSNQVLNLGLLNLVFVVISISVVAYLYNGQVKQDIIFAVISVLIMTISEIIVLFLMTSIGGLTVEEVTIIENYRILGIIFSKLLAFVIFKLLCVKHINRTSHTVNNTYWVLFMIMLVTSVVAIFLIFRLQYESNSNSMYNMSVWCSFGLLYSTFFSLYLYEKISEQKEIEKKQQLFQQQINAQSKHLEDILIAQRELKKIRHDLKNHKISIEAFFKNKDYDSGLEYMKNMGHQTYVSNNFVDTGNVALDAIINTKKSIADSKGIEFVSNIQIPENIFVEAVDACIIFGNALDNCIEACEKIEQGDKKISLSVVYENESIICKIANTTVKNADASLRTTKKDKLKHGFGIENIKSVIEKYNGIYDFKQKDDEFIFSFVIYKI